MSTRREGHSQLTTLQSKAFNRKPLSSNMYKETFTCVALDADKHPPVQKLRRLYCDSSPDVLIYITCSQILLKSIRIARGHAKVCWLDYTFSSAHMLSHASSKIFGGFCSTSSPMSLCLPNSLTDLAPQRQT